MAAGKRKGRPKLPEGKARTVVVPVRLRPDEHDRIWEAAEAEGLGIGVWLRRVALKALGMPEQGDDSDEVE